MILWLRGQGDERPGGPRWPCRDCGDEGIEGAARPRTKLGGAGPSPPSSAIVQCPRKSRAKRSATLFATLLRLMAAASALAPGIALSHAIIVSAEPGMNSTVAQGVLEIRLAFNSRIDSKRSRLRLRRPDGVVTDVSLTPDDRPGVLAARAQVSAVGRWTLHWQVLSLDGHITRGEVSFSVRDVAGQH